ncbi:hypothetical protein JCM10207_008355 [Rhodosporidiobolus poonsookiae]
MHSYRILATLLPSPSTRNSVHSSTSNPAHPPSLFPPRPVTMTTPVSLPLSSTLPPALPPSLQHSTFIPGHHPHSSSLSSLASFSYPSGASSGPTVPPPVPLHAQTNHTRVLLLRDFDPKLKTKDLQDALSEWQDEPGGLKVKWRDDTSAWVVFGEGAVAKRAFLTLLTSPPAQLAPSAAHTPSITPYTGPDVPSILSAVANRPRSRSIVGGGASGAAAGAVGVGHGGHSRKGSLLGSGGGSALGAAIASAQAAGPHGAATAPSSSSPVGSGHGSGHARTGSWQRSSFSRPAGSPIDFSAGEGRNSPETPGAANGGIVAGEAPRRFGGAGGAGVNGGHQRRESSSGSDAVAASVAGLTISE